VSTTFPTVILLGAALSGIAPTPVAAQTVQAGVEGGLATTSLANLTQAIDFGGPVDIQRRTGLAFGAFVNVEITPAMSVRTGMLLTPKGASPTDGTNELQIRLHYLDIPVLIQWRPSRATPLYLLVGPSVNFNVRATTVDLIPSETVDDIRDEIANVELGVVLGGGLSFGRGFTEGRYGAGLTNISRNPNLNAPVRTRGVTILAGLRF
jgi:hypothetical protein